jgi:2'-5' RNA ligase
MHLYFIAIMLPPKLDKEIRSLQEEMAANYGSSRQLKIPVHITLLPPFKNNSDENVIAAFEKVCSLINKPTEISLNGFGEFRNKVLFVKVVKSKALSAMRTEILSNITESLSLELPAHYQHFHPHITIANRDLTRKAFLAAWPVFKDRPFQPHFNKVEIALFKHVEGYWKKIKGA